MGVSERTEKRLIKFFELLLGVVGVSVATWGVSVALNQVERTVDQLGQQQTQIEQTAIQIELQRRQDYLSRRAQLLVTLYDRRDCGAGSAGSEPMEDGTTMCPHQASRESRQEAIRVLTQLEHEQTWHPTDLSLRSLDLRGADLQEVDFSFARLELADFRGANLRGARFQRAELRNCRFISADLSDADFYCADLVHAHLSGRLSRAHFFHANLNYAEIASWDGWAADFRWANLEDAKIRGDYRFARFWSAKMRRAMLEQVSLWNADFTDADLGSAYFRDVRAEGARFDGANLTGVDIPLDNGVYYDGAWTSVPSAYTERVFGARLAIRDGLTRSSRGWVGTGGSRWYEEFKLCSGARFEPLR